MSYKEKHLKNQPYTLRSYAQAINNDILKIHMTQNLGCNSKHFKIEKSLWFYGPQIVKK